MPFTSAPAVADYPAATQGMNFGSVGGNVAHSDIVENLYSVYDPFSIARLAFERHGKRPSFAMMLDLLGPDFNTGVKAPTVGHYERNNWVGQLINIGSIDTAASGDGNDIIVVLGTDNMTTTGLTVSGAATKASNIRVGDLVLLPTGNKLAYVKAKNTATTTNPHKITLAPFDSSIDLDNYITAGETYAVVTNAHAAASGLPEGLTPTAFKYTNKFQIVKEAVRASGSELTNEPFVQIYNANETVFAVMNQDAMDRFEKARGGALFWGEENDNVDSTTSQLGYDTKITWTEGLMAFQAGNSYQNTYNPAAFTLDEIDEIASTFEAENVGTRTIAGLQGNEYTYILQNALDSVFDQSLSNALVVKSLTDYNLSLDSWQPVIEGQDWMAWLGWQGVRRSNFSFHFRMMHEFVAADGGGAADYSYKYDCIWLPLSGQRDIRTGEQRPSIGYNWKQMGNYSRKMVFGNFGGAGVAGNGGYGGLTVAANEYDMITSYMVSEIAGHFACPNKIVYHTQA